MQEVDAYNFYYQFVSLVGTNSQCTQQQELVCEEYLKKLSVQIEQQLEVRNNSNSGGGTPAFRLVHKYFLAATL